MLRRVISNVAHRGLLRSALSGSMSCLSLGNASPTGARCTTTPVFVFPVSHRSFSTDAQPPKEEKLKKPKKSWLQVWTDIEFRNVIKPLEEKITKNSERQKARRDQLRCLLPTEDLHRSQLHMTDPSPVYVKQYNTKDPYVQMTYAEALEKARELSMDLVCFENVLSRPPKPEQMAAIPDDGIPAFVWMNFRAFSAELVDVDTVATKGVQNKDVNLSSMTTGNDLYRKVYQALDMLLEGHAVRFMCKVKTNTKVQRDVLESLGLKDEAELKELVAKYKDTEAGMSLAESAAAHAKAAAEREKKNLQLKAKDGKRAAMEDDDDDGGIPGDDNSGSSSRKTKLSKKEMEAKAEREKVRLMSSREKIAHLAMTEATDTYPVMWDLVETFAKLGAIIMFNRRANGNKPLSPPAVEVPKVDDSMSKKERRRIEAVAAQLQTQAKDPYAVIRHELEVAKKTLESKGAIDQEFFQMMMKKNLLVNYETQVERDNIIRTNTLHVKLGKF